MLNRFKSYGLVLTIFYLFAVADAWGQSDCPTCPKGMTAPSSLSSPLQGFHGYTSEVNHFDGTTPTCYIPTAATLNGHLRGINNSLCNLRLRIDTLRNKDTLLMSRIDSLIDVIDDINGDLESNYNTSIISSDGSINIIASIVGLVQQFNLSVDIDTIKARLVHNLDYSCLGVPKNFDSIMNKLIVVACYQSNPASDSCRTWKLYSTNTIGSTAGTTTVSITPFSIGAVPSGMCLTKIEYIYTLYDSSGASIANGLVNGVNTLGVVTNFTIPLGYIQGARTISIISRFWKERCVSHSYCGIQDSLKTSNVPVFSLSAIIANNDNYTNTSTSGSDVTAYTYAVTSNDITPYTVSSLIIIRSAVRGNTTIVGNTIQYTPFSTGKDTMRYVITDIYGQKDTAYVYIVNNISGEVDPVITGDIFACGFGNCSPTGVIDIDTYLDISNTVGTPKLYSITYINDTLVSYTKTYPTHPPFHGFTLNTTFSNFQCARIETYGGSVTVTLQVVTTSGATRLIDIAFEIPADMFADHNCNLGYSYLIPAYTPTEPY